MPHANYVRNRLSLRKPQEEALNILAALGETLALTKDADLAQELAKVKARYPKFNEFERNFPNFCFALATGVGKTRLMGAFVAYLRRAKGIKNFLILSPNLTIYKKLKEDFSNPQCKKYVFHGIDVFAMTKPRIVAGDEDDWSKGGQLSYHTSDTTIYIFNIAKVVKDEKSGKIRRMQEYLGESFFNHLVNLPDLVLLMDESHHYRAERGHSVINEIQPLLGLEVTATPRVEAEKRDFKNVIYQYSLGQAMRDGLVKEPAVATRADLDAANLTKQELDQLKLIDGLKIHQDTKNALEAFRLNKGLAPVYPFVLVVAQDTAHAAEVRAFIQSPAFFEGQYANKVMEIHSAQRGSEKDENIQKLVELEDNDEVEIVIHVNMLKEGWDVTNLYTIIPLRASASQTLTEQTIGRGLRLPYGQRTGDKKVDRLTIVAHDRFQAIVDEAAKPDSIIRKENIIDLADLDLTPKTLTPSLSHSEARLAEARAKAEAETQPAARAEAQTQVKVMQAIQNILQSKTSANKLEDLQTPKVQQEIVGKVIEQLQGQLTLDQADLPQYVQQQVKEETTPFVAKTIAIPRITLVPKGEVKQWFEDFDYVPGSFKPQPVAEEILLKYLRSEFGDEMVTSRGGISNQSLEAVIVNELINEPEINYQQEAKLLFKLAGQATTHLRSYLPTDAALQNVVYYRRRDIAKEIHQQMKPHEKKEGLDDLAVFDVQPYTKIESFGALQSAYGAEPQHYSNNVPVKALSQTLFRGFQKSCHALYKFHSRPEQYFAEILESPVLGKEVIKWLRPAERQFQITYDYNRKNYLPDFVVETGEAIYMVEVKAANEVDDAVVQEKAKAALKYCEQASEFNAQHGGRPWKYLLIPHDKIQKNTSFGALVGEWEKEI